MRAAPLLDDDPGSRACVFYVQPSRRSLAALGLVVLFAQGAGASRPGAAAASNPGLAVVEYRGDAVPDVSAQPPKRRCTTNHCGGAAESVGDDGVLRSLARRLHAAVAPNEQSVLPEHAAEENLSHGDSVADSDARHAGAYAASSALVESELIVPTNRIQPAADLGAGTSAGSFVSIERGSGVDEVKKVLEEGLDPRESWSATCLWVGLGVLLLCGAAVGIWRLWPRLRAAVTGDSRGENAEATAPTDANDGTEAESSDCAKESSAAVTSPQEASAEAGAHLDPEQEVEKKRLRSQKYHLLMTQAMNKQKLQKIMAALLKLENEEIPPEEIQRRTRLALEGTEMVAGRGLWSAVSLAMPVMAQSKRIYSTANMRIEAAKERAKKVALEETKFFISDVKSLFDMDDEVFAGMSEIEVPTLAAFIASALAPVQLRLMASSNEFSCWLSGIFVVLNAIILFSDFGSECEMREGQMAIIKKAQNFFFAELLHLGGVAYYRWFMVDCLVCGFTFVVRFLLLRQVGSVLKTINTPPPIRVVDDPITATRMLVEYYMSTGCTALVQLDTMCRSRVYKLTQWSVVFAAVWLVYAVKIVLMTAYKDGCDTLGVAVLRCRTLFFLMFWVSYVFNIVLFIGEAFFYSDYFMSKMITLADGADQFLGVGLPVCKVMLHAITVRRSSDMIDFQLRVARSEQAHLAEERQQAADNLRKAELNQEKCHRNVERLREKVAKEQENEQDHFVDNYNQMKKDVLDRSEKVIRKIDQSAAKMAADAGQSVDEWEEGETPEIVKAIARGEGMEKLQEMLREVAAEATPFLAEAGAAAAGAVKQLQEQEGYQQAMDKVGNIKQKAEVLKQSEVVQQAMAKAQTGAELAKATAGPAAAAAQQRLAASSAAAASGSAPSEVWLGAAASSAAPGAGGATDGHTAEATADSKRRERRSSTAGEDGIGIVASPSLRAPGEGQE